MPHFSALTWRILGFNALALIVLTGGVILVQVTGRGLVEERLCGRAAAGRHRRQRHRRICHRRRDQ